MLQFEGDLVTRLDRVESMLVELKELIAKPLTMTLDGKALKLATERHSFTEDELPIVEKALENPYLTPEYKAALQKLTYESKTDQVHQD